MARENSLVLILSAIAFLAIGVYISTVLPSVAFPVMIAACVLAIIIIIIFFFHR